MKTIIASPKAPKAVGPYSQAVKCGDTLYISGQLPIDGATGKMAEGVEAHGVQDVVAAHAGLTGHGIADGIVARVAHVQVARRIRENLEHVLLGLTVVGVDGKEVGVLPGLHPLGLNGLRVVDRDLVLMICAIAHISSFNLSWGRSAWLYSLLRTVLRKTKSTFSALLCVRNL